MIEEDDVMRALTCVARRSKKIGVNMRPMTSDQWLESAKSPCCQLRKKYQRSPPSFATIIRHHFLLMMWHANSTTQLNNSSSQPPTHQPPTSSKSCYSCCHKVHIVISNPIRSFRLTGQLFGFFSHFLFDDEDLFVPLSLSFSPNL